MSGTEKLTAYSRRHDPIPDAAALRVLLDCGIDRLPVDLNIVCRRLEVRYIAYTSYWNDLPSVADETTGMAFYKDGVPIILYDDREPPNCIRFTVAHELGHLILGHVRNDLEDVPKEKKRPSKQNLQMLEYSASQFSAQLLAPMCILWRADLRTPEEIERACHIPATEAWRCAAQLRMRRGYGASPLERELCSRFSSVGSRKDLAAPACHKSPPVGLRRFFPMCSRPTAGV